MVTRPGLALLAIAAAACGSTLDPGGLALAPARVTLGVGETVKLEASFTVEGKPSRPATGAAFSSLPADVVSVDDAGVARALRPGSAIVSVSAGGFVAQSAVTVAGAQLVSLKVVPAMATLPIGASLQLTAMGVLTDGTNRDVTAAASWQTSDAKVATVDGAGRVSAHAVGPVTISARAAGRGGADVTGSAALTVVQVGLKAVSVSPSQASTPAGTVVELTATAEYDDGTTQDVTSSATWTTSDTKLATVAKGVVTAVAAGAVDVTAAVGDASGKAALTVTAATLSSIDVTPATPTLAAGTSKQLVATGTYSDKTTKDLTAQVTWSSSASEIATVGDAPNAKGLLAGVAAGLAVITAKLGARSGSTTALVTQAVLTSISLTPANPQVPLGTTVQLKATGTFSDQSTQDLTASASWSSKDGAVASVGNGGGDKGVVTGNATGSTTVSATQAGVVGATVVGVTAATLSTITVTPASPTVAKGSKQAFVATGVYSDNSSMDLTSSVTWSSSDGKVAAVSNQAGTRGVATALAVGTAKITATQGARSGSTQLTVTAATLTAITLAPAGATVAKGTTAQYQATGLYSDSSMQDLTSSVTWASSTPAVATISNAAGSAGLASAADVGATTISATRDGVTGSTQLTVSSAKLASVSVTPSSATIARGSSLQLFATGTYSDGSTQDLTSAATWGTSDGSVATVSNAAGSKGLAAGVNQGAATVTAVVGAMKGAASLTVTAAVLKSIAISPPSASIALGTMQPFQATGTYSDGTTQNLTSSVTWTSDKPNVATVASGGNTPGVAKAVGAGMATIGASQGSVMAQAALTVTAATLSSIQVTPSSPVLAKGTSQKLAATGTYSDGSTQDLTTQAAWTSDDNTVVTVTNGAGGGVATGHAAGAATVRAQVGSVTGSTKVTITAATLSSIAITPASASLAKGTTLQLAATGTYSDGSTQDLTSSVTWGTSDGAVATVSNSVGSKGLAQALGQGTATVTASGGTVDGQATLTVTDAQLKSIDVTPKGASIAKGTTVQLAATGTFTDGSTQDLTAQASWSTSNGGVASVGSGGMGAGLVTGAGPGSATLSAVVVGVTGAAMVTVTAATVKSIAVSCPAPKLPKGYGESCTAKALFTDGTTQDVTAQATWTTSDAGVATVQRGVVSGVAPGAATVYASLGGAKGSAAVTVTSATLSSIALSPLGATLKVGATLQYTATGAFSDGTMLDVTPRASFTATPTLVASISNATGSKGLAKGLMAGNAVVRAAIGMVAAMTTLTVTN